MDSWIWHKICLELGNVNIQSTIEAQGCCEGGDNLCQKPVQVRVGGALNVKVSSADVIQGLVVIHDGHISVLEEGVDAKHRIVGLYDGSCNLGASPDCEAQFGLLAVVDGQALEHEASKPTSSASTYCVVNHEPLQACAIVSELADTIQNEIHNFFADCVVTTSEVVRSIFLSCDKLLWMEELPVSPSANFIHNSRLQIDHHAARHMLSCTSLAEKGVKRIITTTDCLVAWHLPIRLDAMLKTEKLPASITDLDTTLSNVQAKHLTHCRESVGSVL